MLHLVWSLELQAFMFTRLDPPGIVDSRPMHLHAKLGNGDERQLPQRVELFLLALLLLQGRSCCPRGTGPNSELYKPTVTLS